MHYRLMPWGLQYLMQPPGKIKKPFDQFRVLIKGHLIKHPIIDRFHQENKINRLIKRVLTTDRSGIKAFLVFYTFQYIIKSNDFKDLINNFSCGWVVNV